MRKTAAQEITEKIEDLGIVRIIRSSPGGGRKAKLLNIPQAAVERMGLEVGSRLKGTITEEKRFVLTKMGDNAYSGVVALHSESYHHSFAGEISIPLQIAVNSGLDLEKRLSLTLIGNTLWIKSHTDSQGPGGQTYVAKPFKRTVGAKTHYLELNRDWILSTGIRAGTSYDMRADESGGGIEVRFNTGNRKMKAITLTLSGGSNPNVNMPTWVREEMGITSKATLRVRLRNDAELVYSTG